MDPLNLLVEKRQLITKLLISMFSFESKDEFVINNIGDSEETVLSNNYLLYKLRIPNSASFPQRHIGLIETWKLFLNLCSHR